MRTLNKIAEIDEFSLGFYQALNYFKSKLLHLVLVLDLSKGLPCTEQLSDLEKSLIREIYRIVSDFYFKVIMDLKSIELFTARLIDLSNINQVMYLFIIFMICQPIKKIKKRTLIRFQPSTWQKPYPELNRSMVISFIRS